MNLHKTSERRQNQRVEKCGDYLIYPEKKKQYPCVLKNISANGAHIVVSYFPEEIPNVFRLQIDRVRPKCRVCWRTGNEFGVEF